MYKIILKNPDKNIYCIHLDTKKNVLFIADNLQLIPQIEVLEVSIFVSCAQSCITLQTESDYNYEALNIELKTILDNL